MKSLTFTSKDIAKQIVKAFNKDFFTETQKDNYLDGIRLLIAELDGGSNDLYDEACEIAKKMMNEQK